MTKSYLLDLRQRVARFVDAGHSCHAAARHFEVSVAFVVRLMVAYRAIVRLPLHQTSRFIGAPV